MKYLVYVTEFKDKDPFLWVTHEGEWYARKTAKRVKACATRVLYWSDSEEDLYLEYFRWIAFFDMFGIEKMCSDTDLKIARRVFNRKKVRRKGCVANLRIRQRSAFDRKIDADMAAIHNDFNYIA